MSGVLRPRSQSLSSGFAQLVVQRFGRGPFLVVGAERDELERQFRAAETTAAVFASVSELPPASSQNGVTACARLPLLVFSRDHAGGAQAGPALAAAAGNGPLVPE